MEADIKLVLKCTLQETDAISARLPETYKLLTKKANERDAQEVTIQYTSPQLLKVTSVVGLIIQEFLEGLKAIAPAIRNGAGIIVLGIFYDLEETIIFPVILPSESISLMADFKLSLDSTGYPCSEEI
jgi:hypothetical protein